MDIAGDAALASNRITALALAGTDAFWYVTQESHLGRIESGRAHAVIATDRPMPDVIGMLFARGQFYLQTVQGDIWTSEGTSPWRGLIRVPDGGSGGFNFLARSRTGRPWASFGQAVLALTPAGGVNPTPIPVSGLSVAGGIDGELWIGLRDGVAHFVNGRVEMLDVRPRLDTAITALLYVSDNELWVAGDGTVSHLTTQPDGTWHRTALPLDLPSTVPIRSLSLDGEGSLWVGTSGRGLYRVHRESTRRFGPEVGLTGVEALVPMARAAPGQPRRAQAVFHVDETGAVEGSRCRQRRGTQWL